MKSLVYLTFCCSLLLPFPAWGAVIMSEIAWMGSSESANYEWIELHNTGTASVDLTGWQLRDANTLSIDLAGTIAAGGYVVLERNRGSEQYLFNPPFLVYTGALVNGGTTLTLYQASGAIADQVAGGENWESIGGDNSTKETPQYSAAGWITASPTPGAATVASASAATPASANSSTTTTTPAPSANTTSASARTAVTTTASGSAQPLIQTPSELVLQISPPTTAYTGQPTTLTVSASGVPKVIANSLKYQWNLGDTRTAVHDEVTHVYDFPGQYVVTVEATYAAHEATARETVTVLPIKVSLARSPDGDIHIHNDAPYEIDLSGYRLVGDSRVVFPARSIVLPNSTITVAWPRVATAAASVVALYDQAGSLVDYSSAADTILPVATTNALVVQSNREPAVPVAAVASPLQRNVASVRDSNFTFASAGALPTEEVPAVIISSGTVPVAPEAESSSTSAGAASTKRSNGQMMDWWTTGGLILLLSGTILGLWWQRRLI